MTLIGESRKGFHVYAIGPDKTEKPIATCQIKEALYTEADEICFTMRLVELEAGSEIYVKEFLENSGVHFLKTATFFGLIRI